MPFAIGLSAEAGRERADGPRVRRRAARSFHERTPHAGGRRLGRSRLRLPDEVPGGSRPTRSAAAVRAAPRRAVTAPPLRDEGRRPRRENAGGLRGRAFTNEEFDGLMRTRLSYFDGTKGESGFRGWGSLPCRQGSSTSRRRESSGLSPLLVQRLDEVAAAGLERDRLRSPLRGKLLRTARGAQCNVRRPLQRDLFTLCAGVPRPCSCQKSSLTLGRPKGRIQILCTRRLAISGDGA
jgi:hypothetical protein